MKKANLLIGVLFSAATIWVISRVVDWSLLLTQILRFDTKYFIFLLFLAPLSMSLRTLRWKIIISSRYTVDFKTLFFANYLGFYLNYILPAKMGEFARAELIKQKKDINRGFMVGTIFSERLFDSAILLGFLCVSAIFSPVVSKIVFANKMNITVFILGVCVALFVITNRVIVQYLLSLLPRLQDRLHNMYENFIQSLEGLRNKISFFWLFLLTLSIWTLSAFGYYLIGAGLHIFLPFYAYSFLIATAAFGMIIPSAPGNIGVYHGIVMIALLQFIPGQTEKALSFAIISHAYNFALSMVFGTISYFILGVDFSKLRK